MVLLTLMSNLTIILEDVGQRLTDRLPLHNRVNIPNTYSNNTTVNVSLLQHTLLWHTSNVSTNVCQPSQKRDLHELTVTFCSRVDLVASSWNEHRRLTLCPVGEESLKLLFVLKWSQNSSIKTRCKISVSKNCRDNINWRNLWPSSRWDWVCIVGAIFEGNGSQQQEKQRAKLVSLLQKRLKLMKK